MSGFFGLQVITKTGPSPGGGGFVGAYIEAALAAGANANFNPGGVPAWPGTHAHPYGRLDLDTSAGDATLSGLVAGLDGQIMIVRNVGPHDLQLQDRNAGSLAANQFCIGPGDLDLIFDQSVAMVYYAGTVNQWVVQL